MAGSESPGSKSSSRLEIADGHIDETEIGEVTFSEAEASDDTGSGSPPSCLCSSDTRPETISQFGRAALACFDEGDYDSTLGYFGEMLRAAAEGPVRLTPIANSCERDLMTEGEHCTLYFSCVEMRTAAEHEKSRELLPNCTGAQAHARLQWLLGLIEMCSESLTSSSERALMKCIQGDLLSDGIMSEEKARQEEASAVGAELKNEAHSMISEGVERMRKRRKLYVSGIYLLVHFCYARHMWKCWSDAEEARRAIYLATASFRRNGMELLHVSYRTGWLLSILRRMLQYDALLRSMERRSANASLIGAANRKAGDWVRGKWVLNY